MAILKYPYTNLHELNLDWIIEQLNKEGAVLSVNGKQGIVVLTGEDIVRATNSSETIQQALTAQGASIQAARTLLGTTQMPTTAQTVTGAVDELSGDIADLNEKLGNTQLPTTSQTVTGAIAEQNQAINRKTSTSTNTVTVPKNGTATLNYSAIGNLVNGRSYLVTAIGSPAAWRYFGVLYVDGVQSIIVQVISNYVTMTADATKLVIANSHLEYDMTLTVEVVGQL